MEPSANQTTTDIYHWVAWAHARRKQLALGTAAVAVAGFGIWLYAWNVSHRELAASEALSTLKPPPRAVDGVFEPIPAAAYLKVAEEHPGTSAAARAQLMAAGNMFKTGKFKEAQGLFEKYLTDNPEAPWQNQAQLGVAASLEAQGKTDDAATHYKQFVDRHPQDPSLPQAKSALARLYVAQNKPELALKLYQDMARERNNNDSWTMEAGFQAQELLTAHPELMPKPTPAVSPLSSALNQAVPGAGMLALPPASTNAKPVTPAPAPAAGTNAAKPKL